MSEITEAIDVDVRQFADQFEAPNRKYRRTRGVAARMISEATSAPYSPEQLRRADCRYVLVGRTPLYADDDLAELARRILVNAKPRIAKPRSLKRRKDAARHATAAAV
jgi:hypothetical protein